MLDNEKKSFVTLLTGLASYYDRELSIGAIDVYWNALREFDLEAVSKAISNHAKNPDSGQWMPKVADIVRMVQGRTADQASLAWSKVDSALRRVGPYADVVFDDPVIHRVMADMGGWLQLMGKTDEDWPFVAKEFENRYRGYRMRNEIPEYPPVLIGIANAHNGKEGMRTMPPVLIGNQERAQAVMLGGTNRPMIGISMPRDIDYAPEGARQLTANATPDAEIDK